MGIIFFSFSSLTWRTLDGNQSKQQAPMTSEIWTPWNYYSTLEKKPQQPPLARKDNRLLPNKIFWEDNGINSVAQMNSRLEDKHNNIIICPSDIDIRCKQQWVTRFQGLGIKRIRSFLTSLCSTAMQTERQKSMASKNPCKPVQLELAHITRSMHSPDLQLDEQKYIRQLSSLPIEAADGWWWINGGGREQNLPHQQLFLSAIPLVGWLYYSLAYSDIHLAQLSGGFHVL